MTQGKIVMAKHGSPATAESVDYRTLYQLLTENARELVSRHSLELTFLYASPAAQSVLGHAAERLIGHRLDDLTHPDDLASLVSTFALAANLGEPANTTFRCRDANGDWRWCEIFCHGVCNERGGTVEIHATSRDITRYKQIEKSIERVAREWRSTFDAAHDAIIMLDADATILRVNLATLELFGCEFRDLIGASMEHALGDQLGLQGDSLDLAGTWKRRATNRVDVEVPGHEIWLRCSVDPILAADETLDGAVVFLSNITAERQAQEKLLQTLREVRELSTHLQDIREHERRSIAREVHDELGHMLTALKMESSWLLGNISLNDPKLESRGKELLNLVDRTIDTTRRIVTSLRPPVLDDLGLDAALDWLISDFSKHGDVETSVDFSNIPHRLRGDRAITIFRIVQEAMTNIRRHSKASRVSLSWERCDGWHVLIIKDNGRGFDPDAQVRAGCYGLLGVAERVRSVNGEWFLESAPGAGTTMTIRIPDAALQ
ncbi:MAG: PAS domain S-box protein [Xanthomonadales bacterium]|nr:PAS domain S-box protein [Xanthomonadales bacterium]